MRFEEVVRHFRDPVPDGKGGYMAFCPTHADGQKANRRSLHITLAPSGHKLLHCFARCLKPNIVAAVGLTLRDLMPDQSERPARKRVIATLYHNYPDEHGQLVYRVVRKEFSDGSKTFYQQRPDPEHPGSWINNMDGVRRVLYQLQELRAQATTSPLGRGWIVLTEGEKKADRLRALGIPATSAVGGAGKWDDAYFEQLGARVYGIVLARDHDEPGERYMTDVLRRGLAYGGLEFRRLELPGLGPKEDVVDWLDKYGGTREAFLELVKNTPIISGSPAEQPPSSRVTIEDVHAVFERWFGDEYDLPVLDLVLAAVASHYLGGDPCWVLVVSGSGAAKTETVQALEGNGALVISIIQSLGALLSGSSQRERAKDATGGYLRQLGSSGVLVIKDMTTMLSMEKGARQMVLSALREIHDGKWVRAVGTEGGRTLTWEGRLTIVGACTSHWDHAQYSVTSTMGDRFVLVRFDSAYGRRAAFNQAQKNTGHEPEMRRELAEITGKLLAGLDQSLIQPLTVEESVRLFEMANLTTLARTGVEMNWQFDVMTPNAPEMPTRFSKQLRQIIRGAMALGISRNEAMNLAARGARDSIPPVRLVVLEDLADHPESSAQDIKRRVNLPYMTVKRTLEALETMRLVLGIGEDREVKWSLMSSVNPEVLREI